jgi:SecDF, P1 head subdomain
MTSDEGQQTHLEENVGRLFERLHEKAPLSEAARAAVLARLLEAASAPSGRPSPRRRHRSIRWVGLAAGLLVAAGVLTWGYAKLPGAAPVTPVATRASGPLAAFAIHLLATGPGFGVVEAASPDGGEPVYVRPERYVSEADVRSAWVERAEGRCRVGIRLTAGGTRKLADLTRDHVGERLALMVDGEVVMSPTIRSEITDGLVALTGHFSDDRCEQLAQGLSTRGKP